MLSRIKPGPLAAPIVITALSWATAAHAGLVLLSGPPAAAGSLAFSSSGQLSGSVPIDLIAPTSGLSGPPDPHDPTFAITDGLLTFSLGRSLGLGNPGRGFTGPAYDYAFGGSVTITGSFNGGPMETLVSGTGELSGGYLDGVAQAGGVMRWRFDLGQVGFVAILADDLRAAYGAGKGVTGELVVDFTGTPGGSNGGVDAGASAGVRFAAGPSAVPEPGSAVMVAMAGGIGLVWRFVRKRRVFF